MKMNRHATTICLLFLITSDLYTTVGKMSKKLYPPMKNDVPFIKCDVCHKALRYMFRKAKSIREEKNKVGEEMFQELVEKACNPERFEGEWLTKLDIEEKNNQLKLSEFTQLGSCKSECRTIAKACDETVGNADLDIAEELWKEKLTLSQMINQVCYKDTDACTKTNLKYKSGSRIDEKFHIMSEDERKAQEYLKKASEMPGMPNMQLYSRDELMEQKEEMENMQAQHVENSKEKDTHNYAEITIWETIVQMFTNIWNWVKNILQLNSNDMEWSSEL